MIRMLIFKCVLFHREKLKPYLYNDGEGKQISKKDLVQKRFEKEHESNISMFCCSSSVSPSSTNDTSKILEF